MKLCKKALPAALCAALGMGVAGQASADVYGLGYLDVSDLHVIFAPVTGGGAGFYTFSTNAEATLNGTDDPASGSSTCNAGTPCASGPPVISGTVQNAPGGDGVMRAENSYIKFGTGVGSYSNAESAIVTAQLVGDPATHTSQIAESNITGVDTSAQSNTTVNSNTLLSLNFEVSGAGTFEINFTAVVDILAEVTGGSFGLAQASSDLSVVISDAQGNILVSWEPDGASGALALADCAAPLVCTDTDPHNLNAGVTSSGTAVQRSTTGAYKLEVSGLSDGNYNLALSAGTDTDLGKAAEEVPVPGTLLLLGTGLLLGAGASRRRKA